MRHHLIAVCLLVTAAYAATPEEARLERATSAIPAVVNAFSELTRDFARDWSQCRDSLEANAVAKKYGAQLWSAAKQRIRQQQDVDDRPLYWARLVLTRAVRDTQPAFPIFAADRQAVIDTLEQASRGMQDIAFDPDRHTKRILVTGFDPFLLDRHLDQSNPSGVNALLLDGEEIAWQGGRARIEAAIFPVRYADFDAGMVERFLTPWFGGAATEPKDWLAATRQANGNGIALNGKARPEIDMLVTVSMGRDQFDLERFPGRRRSASAPDNLNVLTGASFSNPLIPQLNQQPLLGDEFVEFSLPARAMMQVQTPFAVRDNRWVRVAPNTRFSAGGLAALHGKTAVEGGGGGYLSNEISYRAVRLRDAMGLSRLPVGHLHTPAIAAFEPDKVRAITTQIRAILLASQSATTRK